MVPTGAVAINAALRPGSARISRGAIDTTRLIGGNTPGGRSKVYTGGRSTRGSGFVVVVGDGDGEADAGEDDVGSVLVASVPVGAATGVGLAADVQAAATNRPAMIAAASRECGERISCPSERCPN
jgi:hypothetical protein